jgi:hypothetical protein
MRRTTIAAFALALLAALMLVAAGCGGDSKNSAATTEAATTEAATTEAATTEEATTEAATTEAATTEAATTTSAISGFGSAKNCQDLANLSSKLSAALSSNGQAADVKKEAEVLNQLADNAPSEIKADFKTVAAFVSKVADIYGNVKPNQVPDAATLQKLQGLQADAQKVTTAGQNISAWVTKNCHA